MTIAAVVLAAAVVMIAVERAAAGRRWPEAAGWWARAALLNGFQVLAAYWGGRRLEPWFAEHRLWSADALGLAGGALAGYFAVTFVYYWWHRLRHENGFLWRWLHQLHHSAQRVEIITSFYKHPLEIAINGVLTSAVLYLFVGLSPSAAAIAVLMTGLAELFYHWNVPTPHWIGYIIQRPESHCVHHEESVHAYNYGDLPVWDMLFGTFKNPRGWEGRCGFGPENEQRVAELLAGIDVLEERRPERLATRAAWALLILGLAQMAGDLSLAAPLKALGAATAASPAPKVFCALRGHETISTAVRLEYERDGEWRAASFPTPGHERLNGPYNRRNVYGAVIAYGPVLDASLRESSWRYGLCGQAPILDELGLPELKGLRKRFVYEARDGRKTVMEVPCL